MREPQVFFISETTRIEVFAHKLIAKVSRGVGNFEALQTFEKQFGHAEDLFALPLRGLKQLVCEFITEIKSQLN